MNLPSGDLVTIWVARDLERLVVKIEHSKKDQADEYQPFTSTELLDVRAGRGSGSVREAEGVRGGEDLRGAPEVGSELAPPRR